jgi:serine protease inhibitor
MENEVGSKVGLDIETTENQTQPAPISSDDKKPVRKKLLITIILLFVLVTVLSLGLFAYNYFLNQEQSSFPSGKLEEALLIKDKVKNQKEQFKTSAQISPAHNSFGFDVIHSLVEKEDKNSNIFISPSSIAFALSMVYNGADGETKKAMAETMHINEMDIEEMNKASSNLIRALENADPDVEISIANSIWAKKGVTFLPDFLNTNKTYYDSEITDLDFSNPGSADIINEWVAKKTNNKIKKIVGKPINSSIVMYLINAVYFYGGWTHEFDKNKTQEKEFTMYDNSIVQHPLMKMHREDFQYLENGDFQAVNLFYGKSKRFSMYVFLPKSNIDSFINIINADNWNNWIKEFGEMEGSLFLPKFKIEYDIELKDALIKLGMGEAFSDTADFKKMRKEKDVKISNVKHKTYIDVNEQGTEAAAATSVLVVPMMAISEDKTFYMEVNKPFFFAIADNETGEVLFTGIIKEPKL